MDHIIHISSNSESDKEEICSQDLDDQQISNRTLIKGARENGWVAYKIAQSSGQSIEKTCIRGNLIGRNTKRTMLPLFSSRYASQIIGLL